MRTWREMPRGTHLKSPDFGTSVYAPERGYGFVEYCRRRGLGSGGLCEISWFADYGEWAQRELVPELEPAEVCEVSGRAGGFRVALSTGEVLQARRVVVATGLAHYERRPEVLADLPAALVSHTSRHRDYTAFRGRRVAVVGAGQSALEAAALLHEQGAETTLLVRGGGAYFAPPPGRRPLRHRIMYPSSVLGPGRLNFFLQRVPMGTHYLPVTRRVALTRLSVQARSSVETALPAGQGLRLKVRDEGGRVSELLVDHVVCGTGYEADVERLPFLDPWLRTALRRVDCAPALNRHFESSIPGLYFIGPAAAFSFGPLFRFVAGAAYAAPAVAAHLARNRGACDCELAPRTMLSRPDGQESEQVR
jgi:FAD-dependent urate hydroxylase